MSTAATLSSRITPQRDADLLPPTADAADQVSFKTWVAVVGSTIGAFLAILNIQVVGASLADIQGGIGAGLDDGGWITTSYLVAEIIVIPLSAWLAEQRLQDTSCGAAGVDRFTRPSIVRTGVHWVPPTGRRGSAISLGCIAWRP